MVKYDLGQIEKVPLKSVWPHEALDFTKWLSTEENLGTLGEAIDLDLELIETESPVGSFRADIYASEVGGGRRVIIENQLTETNHDHLGKIITYAAGKDARVVVWIVACAREPHRQAIEWLNQNADSDIGFFLVEMELWSIEGSKPAPRFNVVEKPNDWAKSVKASEGYSETERMRLAYWQRYCDLAHADSQFSSVMKPQKPSRDHWSTLHIGSSNYHMALLIYANQNKIGVEFYVPDNKNIGERVIQRASELAGLLEAEAVPFVAEKASGVRFFKNGCSFKKNSEKWDDYISWQLRAALKLREAILAMRLDS